MSNAIRFTDMSTGLKEIKVSLEITPDPPVDETCAHPPLIPGRKSYNRPPESDTSDTPVYIYVCVQDSGPGLQKEDLALLFQRCAQRLLVFIYPFIQNTGLDFNRDRLVYRMAHATLNSLIFFVERAPCVWWVWTWAVRVPAVMQYVLLNPWFYSTF
jgi:hypothetical protein